MITGQDDGRILIEILILHPCQETLHHPGGTVHDIRILVTAEGISAPAAGMPVFKMRIHGLEHQLEGLPGSCHLRQLFLGIIKHLIVFVAPPYLVIPGDPVDVLRVHIVMDRKIPMGFIVQPASAEGGIRAHDQPVLIALILQHVTECDQAREEIIIGRHSVLSQRRFQWESGSRSEHRSHGPYGTGKCNPSVHGIAGAAEILIFIGKLCQLRDHIFRKCTAAGAIHIGHFHGFQINEDQIPLLFRKGNLHGPRIHISLVDIGGHIHVIFQEGSDPETKPCGDQCCCQHKSRNYLNDPVSPPSCFSAAA